MLLREGSLRTPNALNLAEAERQFSLMSSAATNFLYVGKIGAEPVACYQMALIFGVSLDAGCRAHVEGVRVAKLHRGKGIGADLMADAERRAREAGAEFIQMMSNENREAAHRFYVGLGYRPSHVGFKKRLLATA